MSHKFDFTFVRDCLFQSFYVNHCRRYQEPAEQLKIKIISTSPPPPPKEIKSLQISFFGRHVRGGGLKQSNVLISAVRPCSHNLGKNGSGGNVKTLKQPLPFCSTHKDTDFRFFYVLKCRHKKNKNKKQMKLNLYVWFFDCCKHALEQVSGYKVFNFSLFSIRFYYNNNNNNNNLFKLLKREAFIIFAFHTS